MSSSRASRKAQRQHAYYTLLQRRLYKAVVGDRVACEICGYDKYIAALHLHHPDPSVKIRKFNQRNWAPKDLDDPQFMSELQGCCLLCANCHAETHAEQTLDRLYR